MTQEQQPQQQEQEADKVKLSASSSSAPQPLSYWALVPTRDDDEDESVLVVTGGDGQEDDDDEVEVEKNPSLSLQCVPDHDRLRQDLTGIYEYYSALYPNPAVLRILHEQQQKQQQRRANESSSPKGRSSSSLSSSFWNKIWRFCGRSERQHETEPLQQQQPFVEESPSRSNDNSNNSNNNNHNHHGLDTTCIPLEAYAMARFCLASQSPMARQPLNPCRVCSLQEDDDKNNNNKSTTMMFLIGLGQVLEMQQQQNEQQQRQVQSTSDQIALHAFLQQQGILFRLDYARGVLIEPNILIVSWGLLDGMVQIYHRQRQQRPPGGGAVVTVWQSVATLSPTATRMAPPVSSSLQQQQQQQPLLSAMWLVTDLLPLVVAQEEPVQHHSSSPAENATSYYSAPVVKLAVARLGTPVELIPLPRSLWLLLLPEQQGDDSKTNGSAAPAVKWLFSSFPIFRGLGQQPSSSSFETTTRKTTKKTNKAFQPPPQHYAFGLPNLSQSNQVLTVAKTAQYHSNVLGLASFSTSRFASSLQQQHSSTAATATTTNRPDWNTELYPYHPPAEHVLIMFGGGGETGTGGEQMSFWSVSTRSAEGNQDDDDDYHFTLQCVLLERLTVMGSSSGFLSSNNSYSLGPDWTLFATHEIWQNWCAAVAVPQPTEPHHMEMSETLEPTTTTTTTSTTTMEIISALNMAAATISVPRPIVNVQCCPVVPETGVLLVAILDANGGVTCMDCARLERLASHTLFPEEHDRIFASQQQQQCEGVEMVRPPPPPLSLVTVLADRARIHALLSRNVVGSLSSSSSSGSEQHVPPCYVQALQVLPPAGGGVTMELDNRINIPVLVMVTGTHLVLCSLTDVMEFNNHNENRSHHHRLALSVQLPEAQTVASIVSPQGLQLVFCDEARSTLFSNKHNAKNNSRLVLRMARLQAQSPADIVVTLERQGKLAEALKAANQLLHDMKQQQQPNNNGVPEDNDNHRYAIIRLTETMDRIKQQMWQNDGDWEALQSMSDDDFVVRQALKFCCELTADEKSSTSTELVGTPDTDTLLELYDVRSVLQLALGRLERQLQPEESVDGGTQTISQHQQQQLEARSKIRHMLILIGTYRLLARLVGDHGDQTDGSNDNAMASLHFFQNFVPNFSVERLANQLAEVGNIAGLSLLVFRHWDSLILKGGSKLDWLLRIPPTCALGIYAHCIPVLHQYFVGEDQNAPWFLAGNDDVAAEGFEMVAMENLPDLLFQKFGVHAVLDGNDKKVVIDSVLESVLSSEWAVVAASLEQAYISRIRVMQSFAGSIEFAYEFSRAALFAMGDHWNYRKGQEPIGWQEETLSSEHEKVQIIRNILSSDPVRIEKRQPIVLSLSTESLNSSDLNGLLSIAFDGGETWADIVHILNAIRPLLCLRKYTMGQEQQQEVENATLTYCLDLIRSIGSSALMVTTEGSRERRKFEHLLLRAANMSSAVAFLSRTSLRLQDRFIRNKTLLVDFVVSAVKNIFRQLLSTTSLGIVELGKLVDVLWGLYETLPIELPLGVEMDCDQTTEQLMIAAEDLKCVLVLLEISTAWYDHKALSICVQSYIAGKSREARNSERVVSALCLSFCVQVNAEASSVDQLVSADLLRSLISDIQQTVRMSPTSNETISVVVSRDLFVPLLKSRNITLLALLSRHIGDILDSEIASRALVSFTEDEVDASRERDPDIETIATFWEALGEYFPHLEAYFDKIQGYVDSVECLNRFPFKDRARFSLADIKEHESIDVIERLLTECPRSVVFENDEWADSSSAAILNNAIREITVDERENNLSPEEVSPHLPRLPGQAVFELAEALGLVNGNEVVVVKCRVAFHSLRAGFYGASAALCRNLMLTDLAWSNSIKPSVEKIVLCSNCLIITCEDYEDLATKRELCSIVLSFPWNQSSITNSREYKQILNTWISTEYSSILSVDMKSELRSFHRETLARDSVDIGKLLAWISQGGRDFVQDDDLLGTVSRYVISWCAAGEVDTPALEWAGENRVLTMGKLGLSLLKHLRDKDLLETLVNQLAEGVHSQLNTGGTDDYDDDRKARLKVLDEDLVRRLQQRGYSRNAAIRAASSSSNITFDEALVWAVKHSSEPNFNSPIVILKGQRLNNHTMDEHSLRLLFQLSEAIKIDESAESLSHIEQDPLEPNQPTQIQKQAERIEHGSDNFAFSDTLNDIPARSSRGLFRSETGDSTDLAVMRGAHRWDRHHADAIQPDQPQPSHHHPLRGVVRCDTGDSTDLAAMRGASRRGRRHGEMAHRGRHQSSTQTDQVADIPPRGVVRVDTMDSTDLAAARGTPRHVRVDTIDSTDPAAATGPPRGIHNFVDTSEMEHDESPHEEQAHNRKELLRFDTANSMDIAAFRGTPRHITQGKGSVHHDHENVRDLVERNIDSERAIQVSQPQPEHQNLVEKPKRRSGRRQHLKSAEADSEEGRHQHRGEEQALQRAEEQRPTTEITLDVPTLDVPTLDVPTLDGPTLDVPRRRGGRRPRHEATEIRQNGQDHNETTPDRVLLSTADQGTELLNSMFAAQTPENDNEGEDRSLKTQRVSNTTATDSSKSAREENGGRLTGSNASNITAPHTTCLSGVDSASPRQNLPLIASHRESLVGKYLGGSISKTLRRVSPVKLSPSERTSFRQRGQEFLLKVKGNGSPKTCERQRLIEQGRELLVRARGEALSPTKTPVVSSSITESEKTFGSKSIIESEQTRELQLPFAVPAVECGLELDSEKQREVLSGTVHVETTRSEDVCLPENDRGWEFDKEDGITDMDQVAFAPEKQSQIPTETDLKSSRPDADPQPSETISSENRHDGGWEFEDNELEDLHQCAIVEDAAQTKHSAVEEPDGWSFEERSADDPLHQGSTNETQLPGDGEPSSIRPHNCTADLHLDLQQSGASLVEHPVLQPPGIDTVREPNSSKAFDQEQAVAARDTILYTGVIATPSGRSLEFGENGIDGENQRRVPLDCPGVYSSGREGWDSQEGDDVLGTEYPASETTIYHSKDSRGPHFDGDEGDVVAENSAFLRSPSKLSPIPVQTADTTEMEHESIIPIHGANKSADDSGWDFEDDLDV